MSSGLAVGVAPRAAPRGMLLPRFALACSDMLAVAVAVRIAGLPLRVSLLFGAVALLVVRTGSQRRLKLTPSVPRQAWDVAAAVAAGFAAALPAAAAGPLAGLAAVTCCLLFAGRLAAARGVRGARRAGLLTTRAVIAGSGPAAERIASAMAAQPELGLVAAGRIGRPAEPLGPAGGLPPLEPVGRVPLLGTVADLAPIIERHGIGHVIACPDADGEPELIRALRDARRDGAAISVAVSRPHAVPAWYLDWIGGTAITGLRRSPSPDPIALAVKRGFEMAAGAILLLAAAPLLAVLAVAILVTAGKPVFFRQLRATGRGRQAVIIKLRTLGGGADPDTAWSVRAHQATPLGPWLRRWHLDELPQLINVVRGQMSLVGPRPERPYFAAKFGREIPGYTGRDRMQAGLTGWSQVRGWHGDTSMSERSRFDNAYIECWSPRLDLTILCRTLIAPLRRAEPGERPHAAPPPLAEPGVRPLVAERSMP